MSRATRIALLFEFGSLNGGEHSMLAVIDHTQKTDMDFVALAPDTDPLWGALQSRGISTIAFNVRSADGQRRPREEVLAELRNLLLASPWDLVHANSLSMGRLLGHIASDLPMPTTAHLRDILKLSKAAISDLNRNHELVAVSNATREFHIAQGLNPERVVTLYNGVDCQRFQPRTRDDVLRRELKLSSDDFMILNVGQIGLRKGQNVLAEAAVQLEKQLPQAKYVLAGQRCSGKQERKKKKKEKSRKKKNKKEKEKINNKTTTEE
ncbi:MAG: glycosyltransferase family 4 protein [Planctomycetaceae bacterium]|nr:glycosyltransferase family 4 protein [Planctomycetaceae bacterium]